MQIGQRRGCLPDPDGIEREASEGRGRLGCLGPKWAWQSWDGPGGAGSVGEARWGRRGGAQGEVEGDGEVAADLEGSAKWQREAGRARKRREFGGAGLEEGAWLPKMEGRLPFIGRAWV